MGTKQIQVSGELWQQICTVGWRGTLECIEGLPEGTTLCGISYIFPEFSLPQMGTPPLAFSEYPRYPHIIAFIFEHPDWPEIELGEGAPVISVVWKQIREDGES